MTLSEHFSYPIKYNLQHTVKLAWNTILSNEQDVSKCLTNLKSYISFTAKNQFSFSIDILESVASIEDIDIRTRIIGALRPWAMEFRDKYLLRFSLSKIREYEDKVIQREILIILASYLPEQLREDVLSKEEILSKEERLPKEKTLRQFKSEVHQCLIY